MVATLVVLTVVGKSNHIDSNQIQKKLNQTKSSYVSLESAESRSEQSVQHTCLTIVWQCRGQMGFEKQLHNFDVEVLALKNSCVFDASIPASNLLS